MKQFLDNEFFPYIEKHKIKHICHLGDLVDNRKSISYFTSARMRMDFLNPLLELDLEYFQLVGNHDSFYKNKLEIHSAKELYHDYNIDIIDYPQERMIDGYKVLFVPWVCKDNYEKTVNLLNTSSAKTVMGHLELSGFQMQKGGILFHGGLESNLLDRFDNVFSGHFHHRSRNNHIIYIGAASCYTWMDWEDPRGFTVFDTEKQTITFIPNRTRIYEKIYWNDEDEFNPKDYKNCIIKIYAKENKDHAKFENFISELQKVGVESLKIITEEEMVVGEMEEAIEGEDTPAVLRSYVQEMKGDFSKEKMTQIFIEAYQEALAVEK